MLGPRLFSGLQGPVGPPLLLFGPTLSGVPVGLTGLIRGLVILGELGLKFRLLLDERLDERGLLGEPERVTDVLPGSVWRNLGSTYTRCVVCDGV